MPIWIKVIFVAILLMVVGQIIHTAGAMAAMSYYMDPQYYPVWSKVMMPSAGPPPPSFMYFGALFGFISSLLFIYVYSVIKSAVPGSGIWAKGAMYGILVFLLVGIPGALSQYLIINLPLALIIAWAIEGLVINLVNGVIVAKAIK